ncbi:MAG: 4-demethylwyosine synthase TYW1 [Nitrososphaeria archaeon]|nr:4-demethylwyosine synthase TYW1 [Nitrososphaeria archaeon]
MSVVPSFPSLKEPSRLLSVLQRQKYHLVGRHSAVKRCNWLHRSLVSNRPCYKQRFYGIATHRCIQMSPTSVYCNLQCLYCWRVQPQDIAISWNELRPSEWDSPETIVEGCIREQQRILSGYKDLVIKGKVHPKKFNEALSPKHVAISLTGEPTLYPHLGDLIGLFHRLGFTTFLVTNGTTPRALEALEVEPTQLYVTLSAADEGIFRRIGRPLVGDAWRSLMETLELMPSLSSRGVIRITLVKDLNMMNPEGYARLIDRADPLFVEPKAYMHVGFSQRRLKRVNMPLHSEVKEFASKIADSTGYSVVDDSPDSRVVLLASRKKPRGLK